MSCFSHGNTNISNESKQTKKLSPLLSFVKCKFHVEFNDFIYVKGSSQQNIISLEHNYEYENLNRMVKIFVNPKIEVQKSFIQKATCVLNYFQVSMHMHMYSI